MSQLIWTDSAVTLSVRLLENIWFIVWSSDSVQCGQHPCQCRNSQLRLHQPNTEKHGLDQLTADVENVVLKIYGYFSTSAKRRVSLKEFCRFCDVEFQETQRHVTTRRLSPNPAIAHLLQTLTAAKS